MGPPPQTRRTNRLAIAALVLGLVTLCGLVPAGVYAVILGRRARREIRQTGERGYGLATAGLILGYAAIAVFVISLIVVVILVLFTPG
jgi:hypothetical protein